MADPFQAWRNVFSKHKPRSIRGAYWYRAVTKGRKETILAMDGAFLYGGRYNQAEEFGALYLSESKEGCEAEVSRRPAGPKHYLVGKIKVDLSRVCDLTDKALPRPTCAAARFPTQIILLETLIWGPGPVDDKLPAHVLCPIDYSL